MTLSSEPWYHPSSQSAATSEQVLECTGLRIQCEDIHGGKYSYGESGYVDYSNSRLNVPLESGTSEMSSDRKKLTVKLPSFTAQCEFKQARVLEFVHDWTCQVTDGIELLKTFGAVDITCRIAG